MKTIEELLGEVGAEMRGQGSLVPAVMERVEGETIAPVAGRMRWGRWVMGAAAGILVAAGVGMVLWGSGGTPKPGVAEAAMSSPPPTLTVENVSITQRLAVALNARMVLVAWSYRVGSATVPPKFSSAAIVREHYTELPLRAAVTGDGSVYCCSLFIADPQVIPALNPPAIVIRMPGEQVISFSASMPASEEERPLTNIEWAPPSVGTPLNYPEVRELLASGRLKG